MPVFRVEFVVHVSADVAADSADEAAQAAHEMVERESFAVFGPRRPPDDVTVIQVGPAEPDARPSHVVSRGEWLPVDFTCGHRFRGDRCLDCGAEDIVARCLRECGPDAYTDCGRHWQTRCPVNDPPEAM